MSTDPGIAPPPPGVTPDPNNPDDAGRRLLFGWLIACNVIALVAFCTRAYVKIWVLRKILPEDATCTLAWVLFILYSMTSFVLVHYGGGLHAWEVRPEDYEEILKWLYAGTIIYSPAAYFTKVTLLLLIARIFMVKEKVARGIYIFIGVLLVAYLPIQFIKLFVCSPIKAFWDRSVQGSCLNQRKVFIADTALGFVTDLIILILPIPLIWSLHAPLRKKVKVAVLLGAGGVATAVTGFRLWAVVQYVHSKDVTSDFVRQIIAVLIELTIGFVCSCLPAANLLVERLKSARSSVSPKPPASHELPTFFKYHPHSATGILDSHNATEARSSNLSPVTEQQVEDEEAAIEDDYSAAHITTRDSTDRTTEAVAEVPVCVGAADSRLDEFVGDRKSDWVSTTIKDQPTNFT